MVERVDDVGVRGEEGVGLDFTEGEGDGLGAEGAADLFEGVGVGWVGGGLDEVDVGEAALCVKTLARRGGWWLGKRKGGRGGEVGEGV